MKCQFNLSGDQRISCLVITNDLEEFMVSVGRHTVQDTTALEAQTQAQLRALNVCVVGL